MTLSDEMLTGALDLFDVVWDLLRPSSKQPLPEQLQPTELAPVDRELAAAIAGRRGISVAAAEDMVRWLRAQPSRTR